MIFLNICEGKAFGRRSQWGFWVPNGYIPAVGDTLTLWYAEPDQEADDSINAKVVQRIWGFASDFDENEEYTIDIIVELCAPIPEGCIPDSAAWPSREHSKRERELAEEIRKIKSEASDQKAETSE